MQQHYSMAIHNQTRWDISRTRQMSCTGLTVGVLCHHWYKMLDSKLPGRSLNIVWKKLLVDQLLFSPVCLTVFFITLGIFQGGNFEEFKINLQTKGLHLYFAEWVIWPPAQFINFCFLPTKFRVLYDNTISLMYDIYTSHICYNTQLKDYDKHCSNINDENNNSANEKNMQEKYIVLNNEKTIEKLDDHEDIHIKILL